MKAALDVAALVIKIPTQQLLAVLRPILGIRVPRDWPRLARNPSSTMYQVLVRLGSAILTDGRPVHTKVGINDTIGIVSHSASLEKWETRECPFTGDIETGSRVQFALETITNNVIGNKNVDI